jgi:hypothetical protein
MGKYIYDPTIKGKHRAFSQEMFDRYDVPAREVIKKALNDFVIDNPDIYKQDFVINDIDCKYKFMEIQVCKCWNDQYPYDKVTIYERKSHYGPDTLFLTLNNTLTKCLIFNVLNFKDMKPRRLKKYSREYVYDIPWCRILPVNICELEPDVVKLY